jgi:hypothetical protein
MTPAETFTGWRGELAAELEVASGNLATARTTAAAADASHGATRTAWHEFNAFAAGALRGPSDLLSGPLHSRVTSMREQLDAAERARGAARAAVASLEQRVADLTLALDQIDLAITASKVKAFPRSLELSTRRKPVPIEFDDIQMPQVAR